MAAKRYTVVFYLAVLIALAATFGVYRVMEANKASNRIATAPVVVAARDLPEGAAIDRIALKIAQWPVQTVPAGAFATIDSVAGRVARVNVFEGEPIVPGRLAPDGAGPGLEIKITPGKRALGVRINDVSGISGMIQPNSRVDMLVTMNAVIEGKRMAKIFMENMRILAIGSEVQRGPDGRPIQSTVATIEVTPEEAERVVIAQSQGQIQLALRGYGDPDSIRTKGASEADIVAMLKAAPTYSAPRRTETRRPPTSAPAVVPQPIVVAPQPSAPSKPDTGLVQVIRGREITSQKFARDSAKKDSTKKPIVPN